MQSTWMPHVLVIVAMLCQCHDHQVLSFSIPNPIRHIMPMPNTNTGISVMKSMSPRSSSSSSSSSSICLASSSSTDTDGVGDMNRMSEEEEEEIQWNLFLKHHAKGQWRGTWTSYDYMGDVIDTTTASVNLIHDTITNQVSHTHEIVVSQIASDCETCFDSTNVKTISVATYAKGNLARYRCASVGMSCGPSILKSGAMSTELVLNYGDARLRVIYQHAPVWEAGIEPGSCPPQGLKLFRTMVCKETLNTPSPPTYTSEQANPPAKGNASFFKPVPPFTWHKKWAGTSWTWGEQTGDRGWSITELEEADAWHGRPTGDTSDVWSMRLPGGILLQSPRVITTGRAGICRLAWLPEGPNTDNDSSSKSQMEGIDSKLLRIEASVLALEPIIDEEEDVMLGFYPPILGSLRCDSFEKLGELENTSMLDKLRSMGELDQSVVKEEDKPVGETTQQQQERQQKQQQEQAQSTPTAAANINDASQDASTSSDKSANAPSSSSSSSPPLSEDDIRKSLKL